MSLYFIKTFIKDESRTFYLSMVDTLCDEISFPNCLKHIYILLANNNVSVTG